MNYYEYFEEEEHAASEVTIDELIAETTRRDIVFQTKEEELQFLRTSRITLIIELFICYGYLKERNQLELYHAYRNGRNYHFGRKNGGQNDCRQKTKNLHIILDKPGKPHFT